MATAVFERPSASVANGKADIVASATSGNFAALDAAGNLTDSGKKASDFAGTAAASQSAAGLMSAADKTKLDGVATGANNVTKTSQLTNDSGFLTSHTPLSTIANAMYPVGAIYTSTSDTSPATLFGIGTWEQIKGRFLYACEDSGITAGSTGGAKSVSYTPAGSNSGGSVSGHTLTTDQIPSHNHSFTGSAVTSGWESQGHVHTFTTGYQTADHAHGGWSGGINANHQHQGPSHSHGIGSYATGSNGQHHHDRVYIGGSHWAAGSQVYIGGGSDGIGGLSNATGNATGYLYTGDSGLHNHSISSGSSGAEGTGWTGTVSSDHAHYTTTGGISANHQHTGTSDGANQGHTHSVTASGSIGSTGGGKSHSHGFTNPTFTGTAATINTMPPYLAVYMWKRTA